MQTEQNILSREKILQERESWYKQTFALFEMVKCLKNRELCFLSKKSEVRKKAVRYLLSFSVDYFKKHYNWFSVNKSLLNCYHSVAILKNEVPVFSYNLSRRGKEDSYIEFNANYEKYVVGYNLFADIDGKENFPQAYQEAKELKAVLEEYKVPYYVLNSSLYGFHFVVPAKYMPEMEITALLSRINDIVFNIKQIYAFKCLDTTIVDIKRVQKLPYSYDCTGCIVLPLTDEQFMNFNAELVSFKNVMKNIPIKERGLLVRTYNLEDSELKENVKKFIEEFG